MKTISWVISQVILMGLLVGINAGADGLIIVDRPYPLPRPIPFSFSPLEVKYHHVTTQISDQLARTQVDQTFFNPNDQRLEGTYIFPLPQGAHIDRFSMDIDGKMMDAELLDADKARAVYEDIVRRMKDPALLEYIGQGMFKLRIYPIEPHSAKRVKLSYTELLVNDNNVIRYIYPLNTEKFSVAPLQEVSVKVEVDAGAPLQAIYSPSHAVEVKRHGELKATVSYEAKLVKPDTDFQLFFSAPRNADQAFSVLTYNSGDDSEGGFFLLLAAPPANSSSKEVIKKDVVFVIDTSGSMADKDKLAQAKRALLFCLKNLNSGDRFNIVRFSTETELLAESLLPVQPDELARAEKFVEAFRPIGGTAIAEALDRAIGLSKTSNEAGRPYMVVFLTDGMPTIGTTDENAILKQLHARMSDRQYRIFSFGVGHDVNTHLLTALSEKTRAASEYVLPQEDLELKLSRFFGKVSDPILTQIELDVSNSLRVSKLQPGVMPDLFLGEQLVVLGRYQGEGHAAITIRGMVNGTKREFTQESNFPAKAAEHSFIPQLWAARRVAYLLEQIRLNGESSELREEATQLARKYGIVTPYTAHLILEDEARRNVPISAQSLGQMSNDRDVARTMSTIYEESKREKSGAGAVGAAKGLNAMQRMDNLVAPLVANEHIFRGEKEAGRLWDSKVSDAVQKQAARFIQGRSFFQNGNQWVDSLIQSNLTAERKQVKFNSDEYFSLLREHPDISKWLSLGRNIQFFLAGAIYEVTE